MKALERARKNYLVEFNYIYEKFNGKVFFIIPTKIIITEERVKVKQLKKWLLRVFLKLLSLVHFDAMRFNLCKNKKVEYTSHSRPFNQGHSQMGSPSRKDTESKTFLLTF